MKRLLSIAPAAVLLIWASPQASADSFAFAGTYGQASIVSPGPGGAAAVWQLTSDTTAPNPGYGGLYVTPTGTFTVNDLTTLSADYVMTEGAFGGGAPRFSLIDTTSNTYNEAYIYWGTPAGGGTFTDPNSGSMVLNSTGNYADLSSSNVRIEVNGFGGLSTGPNPNNFLTWNQFVTEAGNVGIGYITLDLDGGFTGTQQMDVANFQVNGQVFNPNVPEPASLVLFGMGLACVASALGSRRSRSTRKV